MMKSQGCSWLLKARKICIDRTSMFTIIDICLQLQIINKLSQQWWLNNVVTTLLAWLNNLVDNIDHDPETKYGLTKGWVWLYLGIADRQLEILKRRLSHWKNKRMQVEYKWVISVIVFPCSNIINIEKMWIEVSQCEVDD